MGIFTKQPKKFRREGAMKKRSFYEKNRGGEGEGNGAIIFRIRKNA